MSAPRVESGSGSIAWLRSARTICLLLALTATPAWAEPYFAVREGLACSACHVNKSGGGKRTDLVATHANDLLHVPKLFGPVSRPPEFFTGDINEYLGLGGNLRTNYTAIFQDEPGADGEVSNDKVFHDRLERNDFDTDAYIYAEVRLVPGYLSLYVDHDVIDSDAREAFAMVEGLLPWNGFVKAGRMFLPYGLQLQDDDAFIREDTFNFNARETAFEIGFEPEPFTILAAVSDGSGGDRDARFTSTAYALLTDVPLVHSILLGSSFSRVGSRTGDRIVYGFFAGTTIEKLTLLGEVDFRDDAGSGGHFVTYGEANYLLLDWLNVKTAVDYSDNDRVGSTLTDDSKHRVSVGFEPFINRFLQTRIFYRFSNGVRSIADRNRGELLAEVHLFF